MSYLAPDTASMLLQTGLEPSSVAEPHGRRRDGFLMMGGMGGGGMLQALLTEISGLKKPRGILNRYGRRLLGMRPKPPPKYRILVMMATNMPQALDEALLRPGRIDRIYKVGYPSKEGRRAHLRGLPRQGEARADRRRHRQARHHHAVRDRRDDQGPDQRGPDPRHPRGPRHRSLARHREGQAVEGPRPARERRVHRAGAPRGGGARGVPRGRGLSHPPPPHDRHRHDREGRHLSRHGGARSRRRTSSRNGAPSTRPTSSSAWPRWPASACSSTATTRRACRATSRAPRRSPR